MSSPTILVVDDEADFRSTISLVLGESYRILQAATGQEALRLLEMESPLLMILDVTMPAMDGIAVLEAIRLLETKPAVIMLTGDSEIDIAQRALTLGAISYITKPFDPKDLREEVNRLLESGIKAPPDERPWRIA